MAACGCSLRERAVARHFQTLLNVSWCRRAPETVGPGAGFRARSSRWRGGPRDRQPGPPVRVEDFRIHADRRIYDSERNVELGAAMQNGAMPEVGNGEVWIELDGLSEIGRRPVNAALLIPGQ